MNIRPGVALIALIGGSAIAARLPNEIPFHAAAASPGAAMPATHDCTYMSAFTSALRDPGGAAAIADGVGDTRLTPKVFLESRGERTVSVLAPGNASLWPQPPKKSSAACLTQCFRLPEYARTTRLTLSAADGRSSCAVLPGEAHPRFEAASIDCGDGSFWRDVITHPAQNNWYVCATVINTRPVSTQHVLTVSYQYYSVQIGAVIE